MHVRTAGIGDFSAIEKLLLNAYEPVLQRLPEADAMSLASSFPSAVSRYAERGTWLVAERDSELHGCVAFFEPGSTPHLLFQGNVAHIQLLGVARAHIRTGVGRALMKYCFVLAKAARAEELLLQTSEHMPEARRLYESLGFVVKEELHHVWGAPTFLYAKA
ncbi:MAG: GNAT family N-acetyltransferase [Caldimonas sp.]